MKWRKSINNRPDTLFEVMVERVGTYPLRASIRREPCSYCGKTKRKNKMTLDHIDPRANNGKDNWENFAIACEDCNSRKGALPLLPFLVAWNWGETPKKVKDLHHAKATELCSH
jgi:5-methylcytosine-specific restriction endonuclease McrA